MIFLHAVCRQPGMGLAEPEKEPEPEKDYHKLCFWFLVVVMPTVIVSTITWTEKSFYLCNFQDLLNGIPS